MKAILRVTCIVAAMVVAATASASSPPPPPLINQSQPGRAALQSAVSPSGEFVRLETDYLVPSQEVGSIAQLRTPEDGQHLDLQAGGTLELDGATPRGTYRLKDGGTVVVDSDPGYPRYYARIPASHRSLYFHIESTSRVGILVLNASGGPIPTDESLIATYRKASNGSVGSRKPSTRERTWAAEIDPDWFERGYLPFDENTTGEVVVAWIALGEPRRPVSPTITVERSYEHQIATPSEPSRDATGTKQPGTTTAPKGAPRVLHLVKVELAGGKVMGVPR